MIAQEWDIDEQIVGLFNYLDSLNINWFLANRSCLEFTRTGDQMFYRNNLDIGIYDFSVDKRFFHRIRVNKIFYYDGKIAEITLMLAHRVNVFFFRNFYDYIIETRHQETLNRYQVLCYDREIIADGINKLATGYGNLSVLKNCAEYCTALFGNNFSLGSQSGNGAFNPDNIIWEDFIESPKKLP